jgi:hypothetical protein
MTESNLPPAGPAEDRAGRMGEEARRLGHDLNNAIGVVSGRAELLLMHLDRGNVDGARKGVEVILGQMDKLKNLSDSLRGLRHLD